MSFNALETTFPPLEIVFPKVPESTIFPADIEVLNEVFKTLLASQQAACEQAAQLAYQRAVQAIRLDAHEYIIRMLEQAVLARQRMFGASSEQLNTHCMQLFLNEVGARHPDQNIVMVLDGAGPRYARTW